jgi:hypothetical protein
MVVLKHMNRRVLVFYRLAVLDDRLLGGQVVLVVGMRLALAEILLGEGQIGIVGIGRLCLGPRHHRRQQNEHLRLVDLLELTVQHRDGPAGLVHLLRVVYDVVDDHVALHQLLQHLLLIVSLDTNKMFRRIVDYQQKNLGDIYLP